MAGVFAHHYPPPLILTMKETQMLKNAVQEQIERNEKLLKRAKKIIDKDKKKGEIKLKKEKKQ